MDNGQYQTYINDLTDLELYRYENIFKVYQTGDKNCFYYNILKTIQVPDNIDNQLFDIITLSKNTPLTTLSYNIYGTTYLWWLICIVNNIKNPFDLSSGKITGTQLKIIKKQYIKTILDNIKLQLQ